MDWFRILYRPIIFHELYYSHYLRIGSVRGAVFRHYTSNSFAVLSIARWIHYWDKVGSIQAAESSHQYRSFYVHIVLYIYITHTHTLFRWMELWVDKQQKNRYYFCPYINLILVGICVLDCPQRWIDRPFPPSTQSQSATHWHFPTLDSISLWIEKRWKIRIDLIKDFFRKKKYIETWSGGGGRKDLSYVCCVRLDILLAGP